MIIHKTAQLPTMYPFNNRVFSELNRLVNDTLASNDSSAEECILPSHSEIETISNDKDGWKLRLEFPGYKKDEVKLSVEGEFIRIVAESSVEERSFLGKVERRVRVSEDVDAESVSARLEDGILYLEVPHRVKPEPKEIKVN